MTSKSVEIDASLPVDQCFPVLLKVGQMITNLDLVESNPYQNHIVWKQGISFRANSTTVEAYLMPVTAERTRVLFKCSLFQLADLTGLMDETLSKFMMYFNHEISYLLRQQNYQSLARNGNRCPYCSQVTELDKMYCAYCGKPLEKSCPSCNHANRYTAKFCQACGYRY